MKETVKEFKYPHVDDRGERSYVRTPVQYFKNKLPDGFKMVVDIPEGKWVPVDVKEDGYSHLIAPTAFDSFKECEKACDVHNRYWGWDRQQAIEIEAMSMGVLEWPDSTFENVKR